MEGVGIAQGDEDHALMDPGGESSDGGRLLPAAGGARADEETKVFALQGPGHPQLAQTVDEGLPLGRVVAVPGGDAEEEGVVGLEDVGSDDWDVLVGARGVHLGQHFLGQGFFDPRGRRVLGEVWDRCGEGLSIERTGKHRQSRQPLQCPSSPARPV